MKKRAIQSNKNEILEVILEKITNEDFVKDMEDSNHGNDILEIENVKDELDKNDFSANNMTTFSLLMRDIDKYELLSLEQVISCCKKIANGKKVRELLDNPMDLPVPEEEMKYFRHILKQGEEARNLLICSNMKLVVYIARKYISIDREFEDLVMDGSEGLIKAVDKYDYSLGYKFTTYAVWWIKQAIQRGIQKNMRGVKIPLHRKEDIASMNKMRREFLVLNEREATPSEIASVMNWDLKKVEELLKASSPVKSLEECINDEGDTTLENYIADTSQSVEDEVDKAMLKVAIAECMDDALTEREKNVLKYRFGLGELNGEGMTLEAIGNQMDMSRENVRYIAEKAIGKMANKRYANKLQDFLR